MAFFLFILSVAAFLFPLVMSSPRDISGPVARYWLAISLLLFSAAAIVGAIDGLAKTLKEELSKRIPLTPSERMTADYERKKYE